MTLLESAQAYLNKLAALSSGAAHALWKRTDPEVRAEAERLQKESFFVEENRIKDKQVEHMSPDGSYRLLLDYYGTGKGTWNYSRGRVYHFNGDNPIADVKRNYSSFPFAWIRPGGGDNDDFLVCGANYQGQTFINLGTGERRDEKGSFCWSSYELLPDGSTLKVEGCYWGGPYEYKFFDASDPMGEGWPELPLPKEVDRCLYEMEEKTSLLYEDGLIIWRELDYLHKGTGKRYSEVEREWSRLFSAVNEAVHLKEPQNIIDAAQAKLDEHEKTYPDDPEDGPEQWAPLVDHEVRFRNDSGALVFVDEIKSEHKSEWEESRKRAEEARRIQRGIWKDNDPLIQYLLKEYGPDSFRLMYGYPSSVRRWEGDKNGIYFRVSVSGDSRSATIIWGVADGPIKNELWVRGQGNVSTPEYARTLDGLKEAWAAAQAHTKEKS